MACASHAIVMALVTHVCSGPGQRPASAGQERDDPPAHGVFHQELRSVHPGQRAVAQVDAGLWVLNGAPAEGHAFGYQSPARACLGLDLDLVLLRAWAATALDGAGIMGCAFRVLPLGFLLSPLMCGMPRILTTCLTAQGLHLQLSKASTTACGCLCVDTL